LTVALFVLTTAMTVIVQLLGVAASQRRTIEQRRVALAEVANQAEKIARLSWNEVSPDQLRSWDFAEESKTALPHAITTVEVEEENEPARARRIRLFVHSPNSAGEQVELAALTVWKYVPRGEP
jgi:hypothetical protein